MITTTDRIIAINNAKEDMKNALIGKGVTVDGDLTSYADGIRNEDLADIIAITVVPETNKGWTSFGTNKTYDVLKFDLNGVRRVKFQYNKSLNIELYNCNSLTTTENMFEDCWYLQTVSGLNTKNVKSFSRTFYNCNRLQSLPLIDMTNAMYWSAMFGAWTSQFRLLALTNLGGFKNLGKGGDGTFDLTAAPNLTLNSIRNVFDNLYDRTREYQTKEMTIKIATTTFNKLEDTDIQSVINKGYILAYGNYGDY
jgi:hypothetical protein